MKPLRLLLMVAVLALIPGCAAFQKALPQIVSLVTDAILVIDQIDSFTGAYFKSHPNAEQEKAVADGLSRTRHALIAAQRTSESAGALGEGDAAGALAAFRGAYEELLAACAGIPGLKVGAIGDAAGPGTLVVPEPLILAPPSGG